MLGVFEVGSGLGGRRHGGGSLGKKFGMGNKIAPDETQGPGLGRY
jgi:hypothetical protein